MPASTQSAHDINDKLLEAAERARGNPYIQKLIEDEQLRDNAISALKAARSAFERANKKGWDKELAKDKKLRREVEEALSGIKETRAGLVDAPKRARKKQAKSTTPKARKRRPLRKLVFIALIGALIAVLVSEDARNQLLDTLFGPEEEFQYNSATTSSANGST